MLDSARSALAGKQIGRFRIEMPLFVLQMEAVCIRSLSGWTFPR